MFFDAASRRSPVMASSRPTMMTTIHAPTFTGAFGFRCVLSTNATNAEQVMILSASGSIRMPKLVMSLRERAMRPSRKSVTPAKQKKNSASVSLKANLENIAQRNTTVSPKRDTVSLLGRFIFEKVAGRRCGFASSKIEKNGLLQQLEERDEIFNCF